MRTLSAALQAAHAGAVQRPAWLVEIGFNAPLRVSSHASVSALGFSWTAFDVDVSRVFVDGLAVRGELRLGNADNLAGALVLNEGVTDRRVRIWGYDAAATADADFVPLADCAGGAARGNERYVAIALRDAAAYVSAPRTFVTAEHGFTHLLPAGATLALGRERVSFQRRR